VGERGGVVGLGGLGGLGAPVVGLGAAAYGVSATLTSEPAAGASTGTMLKPGNALNRITGTAAATSSTGDGNRQRPGRHDGARIDRQDLGYAFNQRVDRRHGVYRGGFSDLCLRARDQPAQFLSAG
jgi:hypothetical protein